ncbi:MAG: DRTGG domain-containing protein [Oscillospiraceae bacterium]|nr:DRTGG domain-containing protein [Oscillospiraceae bacterium]
MKLSEIVAELNAEVVVDAGNLDTEIKMACGSDMMSDVLAFAKDQSVFLTGLMNPQVVRTAEMMDMRSVIFVRGKKVDPMVAKLAEQMGITVAVTGDTMFTACGRLYAKGIRGACERK